MCTVQICTVCNIYLFWKVCEFRVNVSFSGKLLYELTLDGFRMQWNYLYFVYLLSSVQIVFKKWFWHKHCRCFDHSKWVEGAADLLGTLSQSHLLEEVDFDRCYEIPFAAWQEIPSGAWPKLRRTRGIPNWEVPRIRGVALVWRLAGLKSMPVGGREKIWMIRMILAGHLMWPRHLCVLSALNNYRLCFGLRRNSSFHVFHVDWRSFFFSRALKIILGHGERNCFAKSTLKFGFKIPEVLVSKACWSCCYQHSISTHCCHPGLFYVVPQQLPSFSTEIWIGETFGTGRFDWGVLGRWLQIGFYTFDFFVVLMPSSGRSPMHTGPLWSNRASVSQCFTWTADKVLAEATFVDSNPKKERKKRLHHVHASLKPSKKGNNIDINQVLVVLCCFFCKHAFVQIQALAVHTRFKSKMWKRQKLRKNLGTFVGPKIVHVSRDEVI